MKILKNSEYQELLDYKNKYDDLTGRNWYILSGGRSIHARLMQLSKETLINMLLEMRQDLKKAYRKYLYFRTIRRSWLWKDGK